MPSTTTSAAAGNRLLRLGGRLCRFDGLTVSDFFDAKLVRYRNTPLATLTGFEASGEWDWTCMLSPFANARYVQGTDELVGPLFGIPPLEGTVGFRWHDSAKQRMWEFEAGTRIVNQQNRLGEILIVGAPTVIEERTGGFTTTYLRGFYNWSKNLKLVAGIDNVFNRSYQEHLDLHLLGPNGFPAPPTRSAFTGHHAVLRHRLDVLKQQFRWGQTKFAVDLSRFRW